MVAPQISLAEQVVPAARASSLKDVAIIYFGNDWRAENRTSSHHIAERLAERTSVLYVDSPGLRAPKATGRDARKLFRKLLQAAGKPRQIGRQMWHITVPQIPFRTLPFAQTANVAAGKLLVNRALNHLGFKRTVSWFAVPHPGMLAGTFGEDLVVYYCIDDYAALPDVDAAAVSRMDARLMQRADQVFVASALLLQSKQKVCPSALHAPHGVDVDLFRGASEPGQPIAKGAARLKHPVIGFFGLIESWIDLDLVAFLAQRRPDWTFLMIGRVAVDASSLASLPNVIFPGPQPYVSLPAWAKAFDVAIIPYRQTRQVINSNPLKLREYLATGKPIVTVSAPEIERFADYVRIANDPDGFLREIEKALAADTAADRARRMAAVAEMSWDARVQEVVRAVERKLGQHRTAAGEEQIAVAV